MGAKKIYKSYKYKILVIMLLFAISILTFEYAIKQVKSEEQKQVTALKDRDFDVIWDYLNSCIDVAESDAQNLAINIESGIRSKFDLDKLEEDLNNGKRSELVDLVDECIDDYQLSSTVKNNRNSCIVLEGYDRIIADRTIDLSRVDKRFHHLKFSDYEKIAYNVPLLMTAERQIKNHTSTTPIAIEIYNYIEGGEHAKINACTYNNLKKIYETEGVEGLRNYQFLAPAYITRNGDIFGNLDLKEGNQNDNHKFIVLVSFNLYDQIIKMRPDFEQNSYYKNIGTGYENILTAIYMAAVITCIVFLIISIFYVKSYNDAIIEYLGTKSFEEEFEE